MKFFIKKSRNEAKEVEKDVYLSHVREAGLWLGDDILVPSFNSNLYEISGWTSE